MLPLLPSSLPSSLLHLSDSNMLEEPIHSCFQKVFQRCSKHRQDWPEFTSCITMGYSDCINTHRKPDDPIYNCFLKAFERCLKYQEHWPDFTYYCIAIGYRYCIHKHHPIYNCFLKAFELCSKYREKLFEFTSCVSKGYIDCIHKHTKIPVEKKGKEINFRRDENRF